FPAVSVHRGPDVLLATVSNRTMPIALIGEVLIARPLVRRQQCDLIANGLTHEVRQRALIGPFDDLADDVALARDGADDAGLAVVAAAHRAALLRPMPVGV